jgi:hypothetical protein
VCERDHRLALRQNVPDEKVRNYILCSGLHADLPVGGYVGALDLRVDHNARHEVTTAGNPDARSKLTA